LQAAPLEDDGKRVEMPASMKAALDELRRMPVDKVKQEAEALEAWARAHFDAGQTFEAIEGYRRAVDLSPANARLRYAYAIALKYGNRPQVDVIAHLGEAVRLARNEPDLALKERVYVSYTYNALFLPAPEGFQKARQAAEEYVGTAGNKPSAEVWINLACTWGQEAATNTASLPAAKAKAIEALGEALKIDAGWGPRLQSLVAGTAGADDDLAIFKGDGEVRAAVGLPTA
jgi:tetratricopeptide (TPR) repeat protein